MIPEETNQMGLFEIPARAQQPAAEETKPAVAPPASKPAPAKKVLAIPPKKPAAPPARRKASAPAPVAAPPERKVSGLVPEGDVRLTANIRQDLHLKLKIASAHRRTTIGEIIEEMIEAYL